MMLGFPKPRPHALVKRERIAARKALDERENRKVRRRSGGRCEVRTRVKLVGVAFLEPALGIPAPMFIPGGEQDYPCRRNAAGEPHHLIGGFGRRNVGKSIFAEWKLAVCPTCHREITEHILVPLDPQADAAHVIYRRIR